eukprot:81525-Hanusia_phi.AAC.1
MRRSRRGCKRLSGHVSPPAVERPCRPLASSFVRVHPRLTSSPTPPSLAFSLPPYPSSPSHNTCVLPRASLIVRCSVIMAMLACKAASCLARLSGGCLLVGTCRGPGIVLLSTIALRNEGDEEENEAEEEDNGMRGARRKEGEEETWVCMLTA